MLLNINKLVYDFIFGVDEDGNIVFTHPETLDLNFDEVLSQVQHDEKVLKSLTEGLETIKKNCEKQLETIRSLK